MPKRRTVTHAYRLPDGWQKLPRRRLTLGYARELREQGFTLMRTKRRWRRSREPSVALYMQAYPPLVEATAVLHERFYASRISP